MTAQGNAMGRRGKEGIALKEHNNYRLALFRPFRAATDRDFCGAGRCPGLSF
jgi:hypothetical protein